MRDLQWLLERFGGDEARASLLFMVCNPDVRPSQIAAWLEALSCKS